jgi:hypothetical protein
LLVEAEDGFHIAAEFLLGGTLALEVL